jgi:flavin-dependent dehydrogenase
VGPCAAALLAGSRWPAPAGIEALPWRGTPALTRTANCPAAERCFLLGDAAGYVEPFTGEGMAWALASAVALAPLADSAVEQWEPDLPARWSRRLRSLLGGRRRACRLVTLGLRRPWLLGAALRVLAVAPWLASAAVRAINRPVRLSVN